VVVDDVDDDRRAAVEQVQRDRRPAVRPRVGQQLGDREDDGERLLRRERPGVL
jgi:hypothetical protein